MQNIFKVLKENTVNEEFWVEISFKKETKIRTFLYEGKQRQLIVNILSPKIYDTRKKLGTSGMKEEPYKWLIFG